MILELEKQGWNGHLYCGHEDLGLVTPLNESEIANVKPSLADNNLRRFYT